jgi:hypothetical protein
MVNDLERPGLYVIFPRLVFALASTPHDLMVRRPVSPLSIM